jgi:hypothetical protein
LTQIFTRLNFDVSNLTDIKARKTIATTAFYMKEIIEGKITRPNLDVFILVRPESFSSRV